MIVKQTKIIDETAFTNWVKKHITAWLTPYAETPDYKDLSQDIWLIAFTALRECQAKGLPVNYKIVAKRRKAGLKSKLLKYNRAGITQVGNNPIEIIEYDDNLLLEERA